MIGKRTIGSRVIAADVGALVVASLAANVQGTTVRRAVIKD